MTAIRPSLFTVAIACWFQAATQTPLLPEWVHTWPFGQGQLMYYNAPALDNHVSVDPATGKIFVSIDDQLMTFSDHQELLYAFSADGTELTQGTPQLLAGPGQTQVEGVNSEVTWQLEMFNGAAMQAHANGGISWNGVSRSFILLRPDGSTWRLNLGTPGSVTDPHNDVLIDVEGLVLGGSGDYTTGWLCSVTPGGWPTWARSYSGTFPIHDLLVLNGTIFAASGGSVLIVDRSTGELIDQFTVTSWNNRPVYLATDGQDLFYAYADWSEQVYWGKRTTTGGTLWDHQSEDIGFLEALEVDALGRVWLAGTAPGFLPSSGGRVIINTIDGGAFETFSYGAAINDLDIHNGQAYLTGWTDTTTTTTFLTAVSTELNVSAPAATAGHDLVLRPVPAHDVLFIDTPGPLEALAIHDATGRVVLRPNMRMGSIAVGHLDAGTYLLRAEKAGRILSEPFIIAH